MTVAMEYVFCIPSYHRAERVRTLEYLSALGYEKEDILLAVQTAEDFTAYAAKYDSLANIVYRECSNVAGNRNTCLSNVPKGKVAVFLDDDVDAVCWNDTRGGEYKLREIRQRKEFDAFLNFVFHSACTHNARLAGVYPTANAKFMKSTWQVQLNKMLIGTCLFVFDTTLRFNEKFSVKEDYELALRIIANGGKTIRLSGFCIKAKHLTNKGGCHDSWGENARLSKELLFRYPDLVRANPKRKNELLMK